MFKIINNTINITRGDTGAFTLDIKAPDGSAYNYSNDTVLFTVKESVYSPEPLIQKEVHYGEIVTILPEDTASLPYGDFYVYDVQVTTVHGIVDTVITPSKFAIRTEVTF